MRKQLKPGPFLLPSSGLGTRLTSILLINHIFGNDAATEILITVFKLNSVVFVDVYQC